MILTLRLLQLVDGRLKDVASAEQTVAKGASAVIQVGLFTVTWTKDGVLDIQSTELACPLVFQAYVDLPLRRDGKVSVTVMEYDLHVTFEPRVDPNESS